MPTCEELAEWRVDWRLPDVGGGRIVREREGTGVVMWLFTEQGYLSIVRHRRDQGLLLVRSRDRHSLATFCARTGVDEAEIEDKQSADYRFHVTCSDGVLIDFMAAAVRDLDYDNFKTRVASTRGSAWHGALLGIWRLTRSLPDRVAEEH
jgi:hypothetical protein